MGKKVNRNDPCWCGSGKKYKNCHEGKEQKSSNKYPIIFGAVVLVLIGFFLIKPNQDSKTSGQSGGKPGQVWSEEHGHWHDAPVQGTPPLQTTQPVQPVQPAQATQANPAIPGSPQPPGPVPEGKVWNVEHGHWHDINPQAQPQTPTATTTTQQKATRPPGPAPEGKVWSEEHGHWHNVAPQPAATQ